VICPKCRAEYVPGVSVCYDCGVDLVDALPAEPNRGSEAPDPRWPEYAEPSGAPPMQFSLVTVFVTSDPGLMAIAETMLESARIPIFVEGGAARFGSGPLGDYHPRGPTALRVAPQDAEDARALLADLIADAEGHDVAHS
jgi:hypothetical protein